MNAVLLESEKLSLFAPGRRALCIGAIALISMLAFEAMAVAAAMPAVALALDGLSWFALAFGGALATSILGMVIAAPACDRSGPMASMLIGIGLFGIGLLLAGFAPTMAWLVLGRVAQGFGTGMVGVAIYVAMGRLLPDSLRPRMFALLAAAWVLPAVVGPALAALLVETLGWRWVFLSVALLLLPATLLILPAVASLGAPPTQSTAPPTKLSQRKRLLWALVAALGALGLHHATQAGGAQDALSITICAVVVGVATRHLLPAGTLLAARGLPSVIALRGLLASAFFSAEVYIPLWLTTERAWSVGEAGLALSAGAVCWSIGSALQARIVDRTHRLLWLRIGFACVAGGIAATALLVLSGFDARLILLTWPLTGLGIGMAFPMLSVLTLQLSAEHQQGANTSALQLSDALSTVTLLAVNGAIFSLWHAEHASAAFVGVFAAATSLALLGMALAGRVAEH